MGEERVIVRSKNWQQKREVQYWTRLLNITESEARRLADTKDKPVDTPPAPAADKRGTTTAPVSGTTQSMDSSTRAMAPTGTSK